MEDILYQHLILDHAKQPRNVGVLEHPDAISELLNPSCGDAIQLFLSIADETVSAIRFQAKGCVISLAAASLLSEHIESEKISTLEQLKARDVTDLLKISIGPTRMRCALLSLDALKMALKQYKDRHA